MNKIIRLALVTVLASVFVVFLNAKSETPPGIQKKTPLEISHVGVSATSTSVTVSWSTSSPANGSVIIWEIPIGFDAIGYMDEKSGSHHAITAPVFQGKTYGYLIESRSDYGIATPFTGTFTAPAF